MEQFVAFVTKYWLLWLGFVSVLLLLIITELQARMRGPKRISTHETTLLINREDAVVLDIRDNNAFSQGHIIGAQHIPPSKITDHFNQLDKYKTQPLIIVCEYGQQAPVIGATLRKQGFERVYSLQGGLNAWRQAGLPLEKR